MLSGLAGAYFIVAQRLRQVEAGVAYMSGQLSQLMTIKAAVDEESNKNAVLARRIDDTREDVKKVAEIAREARRLALSGSNH